MEKKITFVESDTELIKKIMQFQKAQDLSSFIAAVRVLCESGLDVSTVVKKLK